MKRSKHWGVVALVVGFATNAHALKPQRHAEILYAVCFEAGLPATFCERAAIADYNTDANEWTDLRAHAQIDEGQTACTTADLVATRVWSLATELRRALYDTTASGRGSESSGSRAAIALGRALHTIQDDCAHRGMPNAQHAWLSLHDQCEGTTLSPDIQPDAISCATAETEVVIGLVAGAVSTAGAADRLVRESCADYGLADDPTICGELLTPGIPDVCDFLGDATTWDGTDRRWKYTVVISALRRAFAAGLAGAPMVDSVCGGDEGVLTPTVIAPRVDVSVAEGCTSVSLLCVGKGDDGTNPFADDPASSVEPSGGCDSAGTSGGMIALLGAVVVLGRRPSRPRRPRS